MHPISLQATTQLLELRGASSASLNALHPPPSADPTQRAICCRIFTPAALPEYPAASVRDYCSGEYTTNRRCTLRDWDVLTHREIIPRRPDCLAEGPGFEPGLTESDGVFGRSACPSWG